MIVDFQMDFLFAVLENGYQSCKDKGYKRAKRFGGPVDPLVDLSPPRPKLLML